jgi:hypothetical protein
MPEIKQIKLRHYTSKGTPLLSSALIEYNDGRIYFLKSPFALKDEIKAMKGAQWHQYKEDGPHAGQKIWSIEDCQRNRFNLGYLMGEDVFAWFDRPLQRHEYSRPLMPHQRDLSDGGLTYHYQIFGAEMGVGKTLAAQEVIERSGVTTWWWIGPKTSLPNIRKEFRKWDFPFEKINIEFLTYEGLVSRIDNWAPGNPVPQGIVSDESSRLKTATAQRTKATQKLADMIREQYGYDGYVILMSGTPSPKSPMDWWAQCEIVWPGFLKEGSPKALEQRLAFMVRQELDSGVSFSKRVGWKDNERKCAICGGFEDDDRHSEMCEDPEEAHAFQPSRNEVAFMYERLKGLVIIKHKKDCLSLPEKRYRKVYCKPTASTLRAAQAVVQAAPNTVTGMTLLRELSDGFQYRDVQEGMTRCTHCKDGKVAIWIDPENEDKTYQAVDMMDPEVVSKLQKQEVDCPVCGGSCEVPKYVRVTREVPCPKDNALKLLLEENEEVGRIVIFAGFTGSVDRVTKLCHSQGWDVVKCDGRGFITITHDGATITDEEPLDYWSNLEKHARVAFVAHPESGGMSLTLVEARMAVYWSNSWKPEYRIQSEDRIHRKGMDENLGCTIVDLIHLPSDERVIEVIRANRKLELMTMGEVMGDVNWESPKGEEDGLQIEEEVAV